MPSGCASTLSMPVWMESPRPTSLPPGPTTVTRVRHTVGLGDPMTRPDIPPEERCDDGLPQSLDEVIDTYGISYFKIKLFGDEERDFSRLKQSAEIIDSRLDHYAFTLDGNENYGHMESFRSFWEAPAGGPGPGRVHAAPDLHRAAATPQYRAG